MKYLVTFTIKAESIVEAHSALQAECEIIRKNGFVVNEDIRVLEVLIKNNVVIDSQDIPKEIKPKIPKKWYFILKMDESIDAIPVTEKSMDRLTSSIIKDDVRKWWFIEDRKSLIKMIIEMRIACVNSEYINKLISQNEITEEELKNETKDSRVVPQVPDLVQQEIQLQ